MREENENAHPSHHYRNQQKLTLKRAIDEKKMVEWISILREARETRNEFVLVESNQQNSDDGDYDDSLLNGLKLKFPQLNDQLCIYRDELYSSQGGQKSDKLRSKEFILATRAALRFGICCLSFESESVRRALQNHAVLTCHLHSPLTAIISLKGGDLKTRMLSAKLLCNLVTSNSETALSLSSILPISPSEDWISNNIREDVFDKSDENPSKAIEGPNWVDAFLSSIKSGDREGVAAVAAALHNCIVSLELNNNDDDDGDDDNNNNNSSSDAHSYVQKIASDPILISLLLRNFLTAKEPLNEENFSDWDEATDWIFLLLARLMSFGMFSLVYTGISRCDLNEIQSVLPEQNILLHCMLKQTEDGKGSLLYTDETYDFLANLFCKLCQMNQVSKNDDDNTDLLLIESAISSILDILTTKLATDSVHSKALRKQLGTTTRILQESSLVLGRTIDNLTIKNHGTKARDMKMSSQEQTLVTFIVQLLGNLCFENRHNQDLMRTTIVEPLSGVVDSTGTEEQQQRQQQRNALHVLLSCTTFATCCFTLREWTVIAIRNVLDDNDDNQQVVANLDAQSPVQTAALTNAGLQVQMDRNGKVSLSTLKEDNENGNQESS